VGSSAMPHKNNPIEAERVVALSKFVHDNVGGFTATASEIQLERRLTNSAHRRLVVPQVLAVLLDMVLTARDITNELTLARPESDLLIGVWERRYQWLKTYQVADDVLRGANYVAAHTKARVMDGDCIRRASQLDSSHMGIFIDLEVTDEIIASVVGAL